MNSEIPQVSIIIACYNHEQYIAACIESAIQQSYPNSELIVIDDGSSDGSLMVISELASQHGFYFEGQPNMGLSKTLNKAVALAKGKYVSPVGSDDILVLNKTEKQVAFMEANPDVAVCGGNALNIDADGVIISRRQKFPPYREITFESLFTNSGPGIIAPTAMIRRDVLVKEGGFNPDIPLEDLSMWFKLTQRGYRMVGLNDVLLYYRKHGASTHKNTFYMIESIKKTYDEYRFHPEYDRIMARFLSSAFLNLCKQKERKEALKILWEIKPKYYSLKVLRGLSKLIF